MMLSATIIGNAYPGDTPRAVHRGMLCAPRRVLCSLAVGERRVEMNKIFDMTVILCIK